MEERRPPWYVERDWSARRYAFFLSHVQEDSASLTLLQSEVAALSGRGGGETLDSFLDINRWLIGNLNSEVIKESLLHSEYLVAWITPAFLRNRRGWIWMEFAYAELLELSLNYREMGIRYPYIIPIFQGVSARTLQRTPFHGYIQRAPLGPPGPTHEIAAVARALVDFFRQEQRRKIGSLPSGPRP